ncbi:MAG: 50S ribosomal protein L3 [Proteobacteria bacterium]|jgi:large subunit ribosomal protein L3|nr:50S ribosomal protein L3 [Pseudomonadota bacterium]|tara:strand:+ start:2351 stop:2965 length:615 start_codon:yes stop_codon:yes gene_type:complete
MISGMLARKIGMSQVFQDDGTMVPVTVLQVGPMTVTQKKSKDRDGYDGVQLGFEEIAERKLNRPTKGHLKGQTSVRILREFRAEDHDAVTVGQKFDHNIFSEGELVSVVGTSKGRGFAGVMKRHGFGGQPASHGHRGKRLPGSIGQCAFPARVFKGRKMGGQYGNTQVTTQGLAIVKIIDNERLVLIKGAVPGPNGGLVTIRKS